MPSIHRTRRCRATRARVRRVAAAAQQPRRRRTAAAAAERRRRTTISGDGRHAAAFAVPDFIALSTDAETAATPRKTIGQVLWDDLNFEREFDMIPRDIYSIDSGGDVARRRAVRSLARARRRRRRRRHRAEDGRRRPRRGAAVQRPHAAVGLRAASTAARPRTRGSTRTPSPTRSTSSSAALRGVARTKLTFTSDRDGERMAGTVENRERQGDLHRRLRRREPAAHHDAADR